MTLTPAQRVAVEQRQTTQLAALVASDAARKRTPGRRGGAMAAFAEAARLDASFAAARARGKPSTVASRCSGVARPFDDQPGAQSPRSASQRGGDAALSASLSVPVVVTVR